MASTVRAMWWGRKRYVEYLHAGGQKAPGGRPSRIRLAVIEEAEKELAGLDPETILATETSEEMSEVEKLADLDRYGVVLLLDELRLPVGSRNRNRTAIRLAWNLAEIRYDRVEGGDKQRSRLDELIEDVATC